MTEDDFVKTDPAWWLVDPQANHLTAGRSQLGDTFGIGGEWYTDESSLRHVYNELYNQHQDLFQQLDYVNTPDEQEKWLESVVNARRFPDKEEPSEAAELAATWSEEMGLLWRHTGSAYEYAYSVDKKTIRPGTQWMSFADVPDGIWDEVRGMIYKFNQGDSPNDYKFAYSDDEKTIRPGTQWMSLEEAEEARRTGA